MSLHELLTLQALGAFFIWCLVAIFATYLILKDR